MANLLNNMEGLAIFSSYTDSTVGGLRLADILTFHFSYISSIMNIVDYLLSMK